jgi:RimJ/RimL family protein N-acetyltransferase
MDERFVMHRYRSTRWATAVGVVMMGGWFVYEQVVNDVLRLAQLRHIRAISGESDYLTFGPGEFEPSLAGEAAVLRAYRDADNRLYLLGWIGAALVGSLVFSAGRRPRVRHSGELSMSVRQPYWGQGIGSSLLATLIDWARDSGTVKKINLRVRTDNTRAVALYQRFGFRIEGTLRREIFLDGTYWDLYWMGLEV